MEPTRFGNKYELIDKIAKGGMAEIFLARSLGVAGFEKRIVIKRILPHLCDEETFVEMFLQEARLGAALSHPNIIQIFDFGRVDNTYFIAMEYIEGRSLLELAVQARRLGKELSIPVLVKIVSLVAEGLHYAHTATDSNNRKLGVVHRDISPSNVLISYRGTVKITDFGIAKASNSLHRTRAGMIKGKYSYMSPQQCLGEEVDPRTDVFSLGIVLFEITTGRRLFARASEPETIRALLDEPIPKPSTVAPGYPDILEGIVLHCLERNPENRYQDAWELHQDLERFLADRKRPPTSMDIAAVMEDVFPLDVRRRPARPSMMLEGADVFPHTGSASSRSSVKMVLSPRELLLIFVVFAVASGLLWLTVFLARR